MVEDPKEYHLATFLRFEDGHLAVRLGKMNGALRIWRADTRQFHTVNIIGRVTLPRPMTATQALDWLNQNLPELRQKFPEIEEFR